MNRPVEPTSRFEAYRELAYLAQSMSNEVEYSEQVTNRNRELRGTIEKLEAKLSDEKSAYEKMVDQKNQTIDALRKLKDDYYKMYMDLLKQCKPEKYKELMEEEDNYGC